MKVAPIATLLQSRRARTPECHFPAKSADAYSRLPTSLHRSRPTSPIPPASTRVARKDFGVERNERDVVAGQRGASLFEGRVNSIERSMARPFRADAICTSLPWAEVFQPFRLLRLGVYKDALSGYPKTTQSRSQRHRPAPGSGDNCEQ